MKVAPTVIVVLECPDEVAIKRLSRKKIDPVTGQIYNLDEVNDNVP